MLQYGLVAAGSALGGMARLWMTTAMAAITGPRYPWGTLLINVLGSGLIGFVAGLGMPGSRAGASVELRVFLMTGFCGGYTTFSSFSLQSLELIRRGETPQAAAYMGSSVLLCVLGCWLGAVLARG